MNYDDPALPAVAEEWALLPSKEKDFYNNDITEFCSKLQECPNFNRKYGRRSDRWCPQVPDE